jgi:hypothetical protein
MSTETTEELTPLEQKAPPAYHSVSSFSSAEREHALGEDGVAEAAYLIRDCT